MTTAGLPPVLVVDDDEPIREALREALEDAGYRVAEAGDGGAALRRLRATTTGHVVLLDVRMPGVDGAAVLGAVADEPALAARHAFVLMTANLATMPLAFAQVLTRLGVPVIHKPFDLDDLLDAVERAAGRLGGASGRLAARPRSSADIKRRPPTP